MLIIYVPYLLGYKAGSTLDLVANAAVVDDAIDLYQIIRKMVLHWQQQKCCSFVIMKQIKKLQQIEFVERVDAAS